LQLSSFALTRGVINEWSEYERQSERVLNAYGHIFKIRTRFALVVIFYLTYQYSFLHFFTALVPGVINTLSVGMFLAPGIALIWRIMTIRQIWRFLEFRDRSRRLHSVLFLLTPPVVVSAAAWCSIFIAGWFHTWLFASSKHGITLVASALGALVAVIVLLAILVSLPLFNFFVRFAHPMLEPIVIMAISCAIGIAQLLYPGGGPIPPHVDRVITLGGMTGISIICIAEFLTLYRLGLRLNYIPVEHVGSRFDRGWTSVVPEALNRGPRPQYIYRRGSGYSVVTITLAATVIMVWVVAQVFHSEIVNSSIGLNSKSSIQGVQPNLPRKPLQGILTVVPNHDYDLSIRPPYLVAHAGAVDTANLTGTSSGLEIYQAYVLPLPKKVKGNYASCLSLNWLGANVWSAQHVIPWSQLQMGNQFCVQSTLHGVYISLLTVVKPPDNDRVSFSVVTGSCVARPAKPAIC
jgi:hypothetical protein